jgi:hypothetical protein
MAGLVDRLELKIRRYVVATMPESRDVDLRDMPMQELLTAFGNWRYRCPSPSPRRTHLSREMSRRLRSGTDKRILETLIGRIQTGGDLKPHLSRNVLVGIEPEGKTPHHRRRDLDLLLAEWGVHHLHMSDREESDGFVERTSDLLFAVVNREDAYLVDVYPHGSWADRSVVETIVRNWPQAEFFPSSKYVTGLSQHFDKDDSAELRRASVNLALEIDGRVYSPPGQTLGGTPLAVSTRVMSLIWELKQWRDELDQRLSPVVDGAFAYWLPSIREERCGFEANGQYVAVGALA